MTPGRAAAYGVLTGCAGSLAVALTASAYGRWKWGWR